MSPPDILFKDRQEAGRALAQGLAKRLLQCNVVRGLVRGGVPVAAEVSEALEAPLDILAVKKLQAPFNAELAIGAICADGTTALYHDIIRDLRIGQDSLEQQIQARMPQAREAEEMYRGNHPPLEVAGESVLVVDDGIATGATMKAGVLSARQRGADFIVVATPVGSRDSCDALRASAVGVFCLATPPDFRAVGQFYQSFPAVSDEEVSPLLSANRQKWVTGRNQAEHTTDA